MPKTLPLMAAFLVLTAFATNLAAQDDDKLIKKTAILNVVIQPNKSYGNVEGNNLYPLRIGQNLLQRELNETTPIEQPCIATPGPEYFFVHFTLSGDAFFQGGSGTSTNTGDTVIFKEPPNPEDWVSGDYQPIATLTAVFTGSTSDNMPVMVYDWTSKGRYFSQVDGGEYLFTKFKEEGWMVFNYDPSTYTLSNFNLIRFWSHYYIVESPELTLSVKYRTANDPLMFFLTNFDTSPPNYEGVFYASNRMSRVRLPYAAVPQNPKVQRPYVDLTFYIPTLFTGDMVVNQNNQLGSGSSKFKLNLSKTDPINDYKSNSGARQTVEEVVEQYERLLVSKGYRNWAVTQDFESGNGSGGNANDGDVAVDDDENDDSSKVDDNEKKNHTPPRRPPPRGPRR